MKERPAGSSPHLPNPELAIGVELPSRFDGWFSSDDNESVFCKTSPSTHAINTSNTSHAIAAECEFGLEIKREILTPPALAKAGSITDLHDLAFFLADACEIFHEKRRGYKLVKKDNHTKVMGQCRGRGFLVYLDPRELSEFLGISKSEARRQIRTELGISFETRRILINSQRVSAWGFDIFDLLTHGSNY